MHEVMQADCDGVRQTETMHERRRGREKVKERAAKGRGGKGRARK